MLNREQLEQFQARLSELLARTPAKDLEANFQAMLNALFGRLDLVTREEFDVQREVLKRTREKLDRLEAELAALERAGEQSTATEAKTPSFNRTEELP